MSRKASDASGRLKISNPQPYQPPNGSFNNTNRIPSNDEYRVAIQQNLGPPSGRSSPAPIRPARSIRRSPNSEASAVFPNDPSQPTTQSSSRYPNNISRSNNQNNLIPPVQQGYGYDQPISPVDDRSPVDDVHHQSAHAWDAERDHRSQMMEMQKQQLGRENKLQNVVKAFTANSSGSPSRTREKTPNRTPDRSRAGTPKRGQDDDLLIGYGGRDFDGVDSVLRKIQREWPFVLDPDFAPTSLALSLLPDSSQPNSQQNSTYRSRDLDSFLEIHSLLGSSLSQAVQNHYQVYASSLPQHANLVNALNRSQTIVKETKKKLKESKELLSGSTEMALTTGATGKRAEMVTLWHKERALRDMLKSLDAIEKLKSTPDRLESLISDKKYMQAALILTRALRTVHKDEMMEIGALTDLRTYLKSQQGVLMEVLIEELSNHLYLKIHFCDTRWVAYQPGQTKMPVPKDTRAFENEMESRPSSFIAGDRQNNRLSRFLQNLSLKPNRDPMLNMTDDELMDMPAIPSHYLGNGVEASGRRQSTVSGAGAGLGGGGASSTNPEVDSYAYMDMVLESLAILGRLPQALEAISQRISGELFGVVDATIDEVGDRADLRKAEANADAAKSGSLEDGRALLDNEDLDPRLKRLSIAKTVFKSERRLRIDSLERGGSDIHNHTLLDLFWTVYSKLRAVLEGHRVINEVVSRIVMRNAYKDSGNSGRPIATIPLEDLAIPLRRQLQMLLSDYLTDPDKGGSVNRKPVMSINEVLRAGRFARDKQKTLFKFGETDTRAVNDDLDTFEQNLTKAMQTYVPGLVTLTDSGVQARLTVSDMNADGADKTKKHRLLVKPNAFNASIMFQPYISWIAAVKETVNLSSLDEETGPIGTFMDDFVTKVYLPQLEERVTGLFLQAVNDSTAFLRDPNWSIWSRYPVVRSGTQTVAIVNSLCYMLATTPFQRENYSRLIIGIVVQYYQKSNSQYKDIVASGSYLEGQLPLAASWSQREDILQNLSELQHYMASDRAARLELSRQEAKVESSLLGREAVTRKNLISTKEKFESLGELYYTTRWVIDSLRGLRKLREDLASPGGEEHGHSEPQARSPTSPVDEPVLELTAAMAQRFDAILSTYEQFGDMLLYTLRIEVRCRLMFYIHSSLSKTNFRLDAPDNEPDPHILAMTADLTQCETFIANSLPLADREFIFIGLDSLADDILVSYARHVRYATLSGVAKIERNIAAVQQALRNILVDGSRVILGRSGRYWGLYGDGPKAMIDQIHQSKPDYTFEEYNHMLNLQCKVDPRAANRQSLLMEGTAGGAGRTAVDPEKTKYNEWLIDLHSLFM